MTIKEIETLSEMDRANIRFYEREGFITPNRTANGYRNYTEDELRILLRIKLLRSVHISLDDIKALKDGSKDLSDTLSKQMMKLEKEKQGASYAQDVCRSMMEDGITFAGLDARKYLDGIDRATEEMDSSYFAVEGDELPYVFYPWRRFLARTLDISIYSSFWMIFLALGFNMNLSTRSNWGNIFDTFISLAIMLFLEPLWLHLFGTTPGKAVFGLKIEAPEGRRLLYKEGLERTWGVVGTGIGYNIPIYNLVRLWKSYRLCSENEIQPWDEGLSYTIRDTRWYRGVLWIGANAILFALLAMAISAQQLPPNRGNLTVAQFAKNYNYYADFHGINFPNKYLGESGKWEEEAFDGATYIEVGYIELPEYKYTIEDGYVTGVSFVVELKNNQDWLGSYKTQLILASLSFAGAQDETGLFSKIPRHIVGRISNNAFKSFNFIEAGIEFTCDIEHSGYLDIDSDLLIPDENKAENYFRLQFSMNKLR